MNNYQKWIRKRALDRNGPSIVSPLNIDALKQLADILTKTADVLDQQQGVRARSTLDLADEVREFEIGLIRCALIRSGWNRSNAARALNIKPSTLHDKIKRYRLQPEH